MATVVEHLPTGRRFLLMGAGYGMSASSRPSFIGGALFPTTSEETMPLIAVCDATGAIGWLPAADLRVVSIDGVKPEETEGLATLTEGWRKAVEPYECPKCNHVLKEVTFDGCCVECGAAVPGVALQGEA